MLSKRFGFSWDTGAKHGRNRGDDLNGPLTPVSFEFDELRQQADVRCLIAVAVLGHRPGIERLTGIEIFVGFLRWLAEGRAQQFGIATGARAASGAATIDGVARVGAARQKARCWPVLRYADLFPRTAAV